MNEKIKQQLSMLLDGELELEQALNLHEKMDNEPDLQALWYRQNLISQALKAEPLALDGENFVNQVSEAIKAEPILLVPKQYRIKQTPKIALALAASIAFLGIFIFNYLPISIHSSTPSLIVAKPEAVAEPRPVLVRMDPSYDTHFNDYLLSHQQGSLTPGMLSHARIVSYSVGQ